jgi:hypothetical protein
MGYTLPEHMVPDISHGPMYCKWLRDKYGIDTDALPTYIHIYEDGRRVPAKAYPENLLPDFRKHFARNGCLIAPSIISVDAMARRYSFSRN